MKRTKTAPPRDGARKIEGLKAMGKGIGVITMGLLLNGCPPFFLSAETDPQNMMNSIDNENRSEEEDAMQSKAKKNHAEDMKEEEKEKEDWNKLQESCDC